MKKIEQNVNKSENIKLEITEVEEYCLGPKYVDIDVKHISGSVQQGKGYFEVFCVKGKGQHLVGSKMRWDDCQRLRKPPDERVWKEI